MLSVQVECGDCGWWTLCGEVEITRRLRKLGLFRRATDPPEELVREVVATHGLRLTCDRCGATRLRVQLDADEADRGEWEQVAVCEICREPIPPERLDFNPNATRCVACQDAADRGRSFVEPDYCPKCGSLLELRASRSGGITRYKLWCTGQPPCRL
ncbi:MAG TPA: TraR/DksA C4-type zinc finger protein [Lacipirellula sp.]